jgi:O-antigen/teichoic acid export membrane protein
VIVTRIVLQPLAIVGNSIGSVVSKKLVTNHAAQEANNTLILKIYFLYSLIGAGIFLCVYLFPAHWISVLLGGKWDGIKEILMPISLLSIARLSSGLHIYCYIASEKLKVKLLWKIFQLGAVIVLIIALPKKNFVDLLWITCGVEAVIDLIFTYYTIFFQVRSKT